MNYPRKYIPAVVGLILFSGSLGATGDKQQPTIYWGKSDGNCRIGYSNLPLTSAAGDPIDGFVIIENTGKDIVTVTRGHSGPINQIKIDCMLNDTHSVEPTSYGKPGGEPADGFILEKILPSHQHKLPIRLTRLIDMTRFGTYSVTFTFRYMLHYASTQPTEQAVSVGPFALRVE